MSVLLSRLQASDHRNPLATALQEYGRLIKTNFILTWLADEQLQHHYGRQLNKGEAMTPTKASRSTETPTSKPSRRSA